MPTAATGRLIQKIARQSISTRAPPASGPIPNASAEIPAQMPRARACCPAGNALQTIASESGSIGAAPIPCRALPAIRVNSSFAAPATTDPSAKKTMPARKSRLRPNMSPSRPAVTTNAAIANRYPFMTHCRPADVAPMSWRMLGSASATTVESSIRRKSPAQVPARVHHCLFASSIRSTGRRYPHPRMRTASTFHPDRMRS